MKNINWKIFRNSAWHVAAIFAAVISGAAVIAFPNWARVGYAAAFCAMWILAYKIETAIHARRSRSAQICSTRDPQHSTPAAVRVPAVIYPESDAAIDAEENAIFHLMMMGATRADAARLVRILCDSARRHAKTKRLEEKYLVDFENHSSKARA